MKVETIGIKIDRAIIFEMETTTTTKISTRVTMVTETIKVGPMFYFKIRMLVQGMVEVVRRELKICC